MNDNNDIVVVHCYNGTMTMNRKKALDKFLECMMCSEGAERDRYVNIYTALICGDTEVWDS